jgi:polysaccharide export outer membrane protein
MRLILTLFVLLLAATASLAQEYRLQPGDVLQVEVLEDPALNRQVFILPDGNISFPLAGTLRAGGRTVGQIQSNIRDALAPNFAAPPTVFVTVSQLATPRDMEELISVYVLGEVGNPGIRQIQEGTHLLQFLAQAGPFTRFAATKRLQLRRIDNHGNQQQYTIDLKAIQRGAKLRYNLIMQPGDVLVVPQRRLFE